MQRLSFILVLVLAACGALSISGCGESSHDTPEATIALVRKTVEEGHAERLPRYIYADSAGMRTLLTHFGRFLGDLQKLGSAVQEKFPRDIAAMRARAEEAAKSGKSSSLLGQIMAQTRPGAKKPAVAPGGPDANNAMRDAFDDALKQLFADPYAWIAQSEKRLTTEFLTDDTVSVLWDGQPVLAPIGMVMKKDVDGQWYFVLPMNLPGLSKFMPKNEKEFQIWGGLITVFDKMVVDLTKDVKSGKVRTIDDLSRKAGEMAFMPAMITVFAYSKLEEAQKKEAKGGDGGNGERKKTGK